jgi:hypothetical protein
VGEKEHMKDPVQHTVQLQQILNKYKDLTARTYNVDIVAAVSLLEQMQERCEQAIDLWKETSLKRLALGVDFEVPQDSVITFSGEKNNE